MRWLIPSLFCLALSSFYVFKHCSAILTIAPISLAGIIHQEKLQVGNSSPSSILLDCVFSVRHVHCHTCFFDRPVLSLSPFPLSSVSICSRAGCSSALKCTFTFYLSLNRPKQMYPNVFVSFTQDFFESLK